MGRMSLKKANITHEYQDRYSCNECGQTWAVNYLPGGYMPHGWWKCPRGCNKDAGKVK